MSARNLSTEFEKSRAVEMAKPLPKISPTPVGQTPNPIQEPRQKIEAQEQRLQKIKLGQSPCR